MLSQNVICFLGSGAGQQAVSMLSKSEFTAVWMEVGSGRSVTSTKGKAVKHPGAEGYFPGLRLFPSAMLQC